MTPLLACVPVCLTFVAIGIVAAVVVAFGMYTREPLPNDDVTQATDAPSGGRPPLWVFPLVLLAAALVMLALAWYWPE